MTRLLVHVEGATEEMFVKELLRDHLVSRGFHSVSARIVGKARQRLNRGGIANWGTVRDDIVRHLKNDSDCVATTMVDFYALPPSWPRDASLPNTSALETSLAIEAGMNNDVAAAMGAGFIRSRFLPFVVLHEFEGLLFSDCKAFANAIGQPSLEGPFTAIRAQFASPEDINNSPVTAPSKRVLKLLPTYSKVIAGNVAAIEVGLPQIRQACPHFDNWVSELEALAP